MQFLQAGEWDVADFSYYVYQVAPTWVNQGIRIFSEDISRTSMDYIVPLVSMSRYLASPNSADGYLYPIFHPLS